MIPTISVRVVGGPHCGRTVNIEASSRTIVMVEARPAERSCSEAVYEVLRMSDGDWVAVRKADAGVAA